MSASGNVKLFNLTALRQSCAHAGRRERERMGVCGSTASNQAASRETAAQEARSKERLAERARIESSELLNLVLVSPIECEIQAHALETVHELLRVVSQRLGLQPSDGRHLELDVADEVVTDRTQTLWECALRQNTHIAVVGDVEALRARRLGEQWPTDLQVSVTCTWLTQS